MYVYTLWLHNVPIVYMFCVVASLLINHQYFFLFQPRSDCPWLAYTTLCAEQQYEEEEGIWKALLRQLRQDPKATIDTALKVHVQYMMVWGTVPL